MQTKFAQDEEAVFLLLSERELYSSDYSSSSHLYCHFTRPLLEVSLYQLRGLNASDPVSVLFCGILLQVDQALAESLHTGML
jgi:hypothetical protein